MGAVPVTEGPRGGWVVYSQAPHPLFKLEAV